MKRTIVVFACILLSVSILLYSSWAVIFKMFDSRIDYSMDEKLFLDAKNSRYISFMAFDGEGNSFEYCRPALGGENLWCDYSEVSESVIDAIVSAEDRDFFKHSGVNIRRTALAVLNYALSLVGIGGREFGASTITQQVVKNISGDSDRSVKRKVSEILRSRRIEDNHSKEEILELYLNIIPLSGGINGIRLGALSYFGKEPKDLSVVESATIAGITNAPGRYDPYKHPKECIEKRNRVLYAMMDNGRISREDYEDYINLPLDLNGEYRRDVGYDWFTETAIAKAIKDLAQKYDLSTRAAELSLYSGCTVYLTVNPDVQRILNEYFQNEENLPAEIRSGLGLGFAVYDSASGDLCGIIGGAGEKSADRVTNLALVNHPPASALKPLSVYSMAIDQGLINYSTMMEDTPVYELDGRPYPRNSPDEYSGNITIKDAIARSKNTVAVRLYDMLGSDTILKKLRDGFGIDSLVSVENDSSHNDLGASPLALGQLTKGISIDKLTHCYTSFVNKGLLKGGRCYYSVQDSRGRAILVDDGDSARVMSDSTASIMLGLLSTVAEEGTARSVKIKDIVDTAVKTGTSGSDRDRLIVGTTPYFTAGIWVGYKDDSRTIGSISKSHIRIWDEIMILLHEECAKEALGNNPRIFDTGGTINAEYCTHSGKLAGHGCLSVEEGIYSITNLPDGFCDKCRGNT